MRKTLALIGLSAAFVAISPLEAESCTCIMSGPPCQEAWQAPVVFAGTVIEMHQAPSGSGIVRVRLKVTEAFRGVEVGEIDIHLRGGGGGTCDPPFQMGQSWLVYANNRWEGGPGWTASSCSRTRLLQNAGEDLEYLRLPDAQKPQSRIVGQVQHQVFDLANRNYGPRNQPVSGVPVIVSDGSTKLETRTDADGRYAVRVEARRAYTVEFGKVEGLTVAGYPRQVWLPHHLACSAVDGYARYDGRIAGQVVDNRGRPIPFFPLTLHAAPRIPFGGFEKHGFTDATGRFEFTGVDPAVYMISPSTSLWRNTEALPALTAAALTMPPAGRVDTRQLRMPESVKTTLVEILVVDESDKPVAGASVRVKQPDTYHSIYPDSMTRTDARGMFRVSLVAGRRYEVEVFQFQPAADGGISRTAKAVIESTGVKPLRLRLAPAR
jgi:hypothetical protein